MAIMTPPRPRGRQPKPAGVTPEDLLNTEDGDRFELIDGKLVERNMGQKSSGLALVINSRIVGTVPRNIAWVGQSDTGFRIFPDPSMVRSANGSYTSRNRLPGGVPFEGYSTVAPELVLEVVSPNDKADDVGAKALLWLRAGVAVVWVVYPAGRYVQVWRATGEIVVRREDDVLDGEDVIPGFTMPVADIFEPLNPPS
ncbi:MAG: Uma2 family endonuclease [Tepidiformaceae bacterium]